jgi:cystathionine gamma-lyase/cystathionine beta-lyase/cystathionine gamma-lyase/homocysteine desulfhydrase
LKGDSKSRGFATRAIHAGQAPDPVTGAVAVPIYQTSTYVYEELGVHKGFEYARVQNPTRHALEANVAALEEGLSGHAYASGMAAIATMMTMLRAGDHVVASRTVYGGTYRFFTKILERFDLRFSWVDTTRLELIAEAITDRTRMIYLETPTNPLMEITDIRAVAELARSRGGDIRVVVDNTFLSPYLQRPLTLGADIVVHSTTKFLNGHSDSIGGVLVANRADDSEWFSFATKSMGAILSPIESFLIMRGIKTLPVRMERHEANARAIATLLDGHPKVGRVLYPGLPSHPGHELQKRQASGFGAMITFDLGSYAAAKRLLDRLEVMSLAESLGGVETLISHPASMTHASMPAEERAKIGLTDGLVRVSVGIESLDDLQADLECGLAAV